MKIHVVADAERNVIGTMVDTPPSPEGHRTIIFPVGAGHTLHRLEVPDELAGLPPGELHIRLKEHLGPASS